MRFFQKGDQMGRAQNRPTRDMTLTRQIGRNNKDPYPKKKRKRTEIISGGDTLPVKGYRNFVNNNRYTTKTTKEAERLDLGRGTYKTFNSLKDCMTKILCLAHYNANNDNMITTDASTKDLGAAQHSGRSKKREIQNQLALRVDFCRIPIKKTPSLNWNFSQ